MLQNWLSREALLQEVEVYLAGPGPEEFLGVKNFTDMKRVIAAQLRKKGAKEKEIKKVVDDVVDSLAEKMDMNKAIGWTQEDSDRANLGLYEP